MLSKDDLSLELIQHQHLRSQGATSDWAKSAENAARRYHGRVPDVKPKGTEKHHHMLANQAHFLRQVFEFDDHSKPGRFRIVLQKIPSAPPEKRILWQTYHGSQRSRSSSGLLLCLVETLTVSVLIQRGQDVRSKLCHTSWISSTSAISFSTEGRRLADVQDG